MNIKKLTVSAIMAISLTACSPHNVDDIKIHAEKTLNDAGYEVVGYEGYKWGAFGTFGGCVYYNLKRFDDDKVVYSACVSKWGDEYHIYNLKAVNAIRGN